MLTGEGTKWAIGARREGWSPMCLAIDPRDAARVLCGTFGAGLWISEDGGRDWRQIELAHDKVTALAFDPSEPSTVWAGTELSAVYRSGDGGRTWEEMAALQRLASKPDWFYPPRPEVHYVRCITPHPNEPGRAFVAIEQGGLMSTRDYGETWQDRVPGGPFDIHTLLIHPDAPDRLCAVTGNGFVRAGYGYWESPDAGATWSWPTAGMAHHYLWGLAVDPADPDAMVMSGANCPTALHSPMVGESFIYRRTGNGWVPCGDGLADPRGTIEPLLASSSGEPGTFYALTNKGIFRSVDQGASRQGLEVPWEPQFAVSGPRAIAIAG
ncbi:MAG: hypothetical protein JO181_12585 [Solirubrobacterales bacterium]|nr:hypothetical protein [Solirubrobacterales bacterium]